MRKDTLRYTVSHKFYLLILSVFLVITVSLMTALICNTDNLALVAILSSAISICGGGIPSVITAWLIEIHNCKLLNKNLSELKTISLNSLQGSFFFFFMSFVVLNKDKTSKKIWTDWAKNLIENINENDFNNQKSFIMNHVKAIKNEIEQIISRKEIIASQRILSPSDLIALQNIHSNLIIWGSILSEPIFKKDLYFSIIGDLNLFLGKCEPLKFLCTVIFDDYEDLFNAAAC